MVLFLYFVITFQVRIFCLLCKLTLNVGALLTYMQVGKGIPYIELLPDLKSDQVLIFFSCSPLNSPTQSIVH